MKEFFKKVMEYFWEWAFFICTIILILAGLSKIDDFLLNEFGYSATRWGLGIFFAFVHLVSYVKKIERDKEEFHTRAKRLLENPVFEKFSILEQRDILDSIYRLYDNK